MGNGIWKIGQRTREQKRHPKSYKVPSRNRFDYLDKTKGLINDKQMELKQLEAERRKSPMDIEIDQRIKQTKRDMQMLYQEFLSPKNQAHTFFVRGGIEDALAGKGFYELNTREERLRMLEKEWKSRLPKEIKGKELGLRSFVYSPGDDIRSLTLYEQKEIIRTTIEKTMADFEKRYLGKADSLSYSFAIHTDTKNVHGHIYLLPYSDKKGKYLSMNASHYKKKTPRETLLEDKKIFLQNQAEKNLGLELTRLQLAKEPIPQIAKEPTLLDEMILTLTLQKGQELKR